MLGPILIVAVCIAIGIGLVKKFIWLIKLTSIIAIILIILNITGILVLV